jgi:hypothetical protein
MCQISIHYRTLFLTSTLLEQAEITAMAPMDDGDPSWLSTQGTKIDDPDIRETGSNEQARQTLWIGQRRCGEIASATFLIGEKCFNGLILEFDQNPHALRQELLKEPISADQQGLVTLPERPGFGVELDPVAVERYPLRHHCRTGRNRYGGFLLCSLHRYAHYARRPPSVKPA